MEPFQQIEQFYRGVIQYPIPDEPKALSRVQVASAVEHFEEEIREFLAATTLEDQVDACIDLGWLALGWVIKSGAPLDDHFLEVVRANMSRVAGRNPSRPLTDGYDAVKPEGWVGPDHSGVLERHRLALQQERQRELAALAAASIEEGTTDARKASSAVAKPRLPRVALIGYARHGKDTAAEMLRDLYGFRFTASSLFCAERVMMPAFERRGVHYASAEECFEDRGNHRAFWYDEIAAYNSPDKSRLAREILYAGGNDIYVGVRDYKELWAAQAAGLFDLVVWVDAQGRGLPVEPPTSCTVAPWMADVRIDNSGSLEDLERNLANLMLSQFGLSLVDLPAAEACR